METGMRLMKANGSTLGEDARPDQALVEASVRRTWLLYEQVQRMPEQRQVDVDAIAAYADETDRQVVKILNLDLDNLPKYEIDKIGNRQYQVIDELGESVDGNTYSTLKAARKGVEIAQKAQYKVMSTRREH